MSRAAGQRWWSLAGAGLALVGFGWVLTRIDPAELWATFAAADPLFVLLVPTAIAAEQGVRAWKWRQILLPLCRIGTGRLFGAIMVGYFTNFLVPFGASPLIRSWLIARLECLTTSAVLATAAIDRLIDAVVFAAIVIFVATVAAFPDPSGNIRLGLMVGAGFGLALGLGLLLVLALQKRRVDARKSWLLRAAARLPRRLARRLRALVIAVADGVVWPQACWRRGGIIGASLVIKLIAASHFLWAGLAFGILLRPLDYLFLMVFLGFLVILTRFARVPGGFVVGAIFALELFGVAHEAAVATATLLVVANMLTVSLIGSLTLWRHGVTLDSLRREDNGAARTA